MAGFATIVLAGGASSRMGRPKALLPFGAETLVERMVRRMAAVSSEVIVVSGPHLVLPPLAAGARIVEDEEPLGGPLSGIRYGLRAATSELCFVCGCDHPFFVPAVAEYLVDRCRAVPDALGAWPRWKTTPQPLLGAYRRTILPVVESMLFGGRRRAIDLPSLVTIVDVAASEVLAVDPSGGSFRDVDTPEDYAEALRERDVLR